MPANEIVAEVVKVPAKWTTKILLLYVLLAHGEKAKGHFCLLHLPKLVPLVGH